MCQQDVAAAAARWEAGAAAVHGPAGVCVCEGLHNCSDYMVNIGAAEDESVLSNHEHE